MDVYDRAIEFYGVQEQKMKTIEECSELARAISRNDVENVAEEIADVEIMLTQAKRFYGIHDEVAQQKSRKLRRLNKRIRDELYRWSAKKGDRFCALPLANCEVRVYDDGQEYSAQLVYGNDRRSYHVELFKTPVSIPGGIGHVQHRALVAAHDRLQEDARRAFEILHG